MPIDIQATGYMGLAFEATAGTYVAPTKFFPIRSESLQFVQDTHWRRPIRAINDINGAVPGDAHVEGDIEMELLEDALPYFLYASRNDVVKTGAADPFTYTTTPKHGALPVTARTLSITIVRAGIVFGYTGCVVGSMSFGVDGPIGTMTFSILGRDEAVASLPTPSFPTTTPYGSGNWNIQVPTATQIFDVDTFEFSIEDNATAEPRLRSSRGAAFVRFGERNLGLTLERDFDGRADYDAFKALTSQSIMIRATKSASRQIDLKMPVAIKDTYDMGGLSSQGDLVRASIAYQGAYDATTSKSYEIIVLTSESIT